MQALGGGSAEGLNRLLKEMALALLGRATSKKATSEGVASGGIERTLSCRWSSSKLVRHACRQLQQAL
eukprot:12903761-Prorocentrum_lima.AAC.1